MRGLTFCSALPIGAFLAALTFGQTTEVTVEKGAVKAQTENGTVTLVPGQKGILKEGDAPEVRIDEPLVADVMQMKKWLDEERRKAHIPSSDNATIQSFGFGENQMKAAAYAEVPAADFIAAKRYSRETGNLEIGQIGMKASVNVYDMAGKKLTAEEGEEGKLYAHVGELDPTSKLQLIMVANSETPEFLTQKDGNLRRCLAGNGSANSLNYYRVILPQTAVFVSSWPSPVCVNDADGRTAVTLRQRNLANGDNFVIAYLWPAKDGVIAESLPPEYRGLRDPRDVQISEFYQREMADILAGAVYRDQSTPVAALLTWRCALVKNDKELQAESHYDKKLPPVSDAAKTYFVEDMTFLSTPAWPEQPKEGYIHPVYMCFPGTLLRCDTHAIIFHNGKWRVIGNTGNWRDTDVSVFEKFR
ncbi:MAG: hypothetical protein ABSA67_03445 [Candidatus Brocadiia bacterium]|jgi:hypothetical protein